jgi:hypothetical protein
MGSQRDRKLELLERAIQQTTRIQNGSVDRAVLLVGIAMQLTTTETPRVWEIISHAVKAANGSDDFNGENWVRFSLPTGEGIKTVSIGGENFSLFRLFQFLAREDLYRSVDLAKSFKNDSPRATSILAIASAILKENEVDNHRKEAKNAK